MATDAGAQLYGANPGFANTTDEQEAGLDVWGFLRRRKSFIIVLAILGTGIGYLTFQRQIPRYRSSSWVQVIHRSADQRLDNLLAERDIIDAGYVIVSPSVLVPAVEKHSLTKLTMLTGLSSSEAAERIAGMIKTRSLSSNVVEISCEGSRDGEIPLIVNAVSEEYIHKQQENYKDARVELEQLLSRARDDLHAELTKKEEEYQKFRESSRLMSDGRNPHRERQQVVLDEVSRLSIQQTSLRAELKSLEEALRDGGSREALLMLVGKTTENHAVGAASAGKVDEAVSNARTMAEAMFPLLVEQAQLEAELGSDHPRLEAIRRRIEFTRSHMESLAGFKSEPSDTPKPQRQDFLAVYLQSLRQELLALDKKRIDLESQAAVEENSARILMQDEIENEKRIAEKERLSQLFEDTLLQMRQTQVNADMGGIKAQILTPARHGVLVFPKLSQFLGLGAFLGAFAGAALGYLVEMADRSFRKPEDIIREFGVPIVGHIPFMKDDRLKSIPANAVMDKTAVCVHLPRSRPAEAYRSVRTAVCFSALGGSHRLIQVTSPAAGDGKSTLALNLSTAMAMSGKKTILVESDFRRPKVHKLTGVENKTGVVDVLRGTVELSDAIKPTNVEDFFVLPCGSRPKNPAELLSRPEYEQLLELLRQKFDYVIIDTPPVLAVTDPCSVSPRVDGVLIAMRLSRHTRDLGRRTLDQLRDVGATVSGIVINGVEESDGYGYGSYRYSDYKYYYKSYNYNYGNYYAKSAKEEYYSDEDTDSGSDVLIPAKTESESKNS